MKILVVSNLYPPHYIGGYEIGCRDITNLLRAKGHDVRVLTSDYVTKNQKFTNDEPHIFRELHHSLIAYGPWKTYTSLFRECKNRRLWEKQVIDFKPDIVYFWNMANISLWMMADASEREIPSACYVSDQWLENPPIVDHWLKCLAPRKSLKGKLLRTLMRYTGKLLGFSTTFNVRRLPELHFTSHFIEKGVKDRHLVPSSSEVIHWGVHHDYIENLNDLPVIDNGSFEILYSGQIVALKGVKTAIQGVAKLIKKFPNHNIRFKLAGSGPEAFRSEMEALIKELGVGASITLLGGLNRPELIQLFRKSNVYILSSEWQEPFAISPLEAMASGCAVVGTHTGGSPELLLHGDNSLVFEAGNPSDLAEKLEVLLTNASTFTDIRKSGFDHVRKHHRLEDMANKIEKKLMQLYTNTKSIDNL